MVYVKPCGSGCAMEYVMETAYVTAYEMLCETVY